MKAASVFLVGFTLLPLPASAAARWAAPIAPVVRQADGLVVIPHAAVMPDPKRVYRAVFNATQGAEKPDQLVPALDMAGSELNVLAGSGVPLSQAKFVVIFHGDAIDALLDDAHYRSKHRVANPNLPVIATLKKEGVELYVCGQNLAALDVDPATLTPDVKVALDALIVLMAYQADGYALMSY